MALLTATDACLSNMRGIEHKQNFDFRKPLSTGPQSHGPLISQRQRVFVQSVLPS